MPRLITEQGSYVHASGNFREVPVPPWKKKRSSEGFGVDPTSGPSFEDLRASCGHKPYGVIRRSVGETGWPLVKVLLSAMFREHGVWRIPTGLQVKNAHMCSGKPEETQPATL